MSVQECNECSLLLNIIQEATLSCSLLETRIAKARGLRDLALVAHITAVRVNFGNIVSETKAEMRLHQTNMHALEIPHGSLAVCPASQAKKHVCDATCAAKLNVDTLAAALAQSSDLLSGAILSGSDDLIEKYYARVRETAARLSRAACAFRVHQSESTADA